MSGRQMQQMDLSMFKPQYCVWELTLACNLRCGHCGTSAGKPRPDELDTQQCLDLVAQLARLGCRLITLSGGEPTLRKDWFTIASAIHDHGMLVNMVTNGYHFTPEMAKQIKQAGMANVAISMDGTREVHDRIRKEGSFDRCINTLKILKDEGIATAVMTTVNTLNIGELDDIHDIAAENGAGKWRTQLGKPMGNMQDNDELVIKPRDLLRLLPSLWNIKQRSDIEVTIGDSIGYYGPYDTELRSVSWDGRPQCWGGCQAGRQAIGIEANGGIKGCLSIQAYCRDGSDPYVEGNIRERSLADIWFDPKSFSFNRTKDLNHLTGFCSSCGHRQLCRGGATCVATAVTGKRTEDPYCYYRISEMATRWPARASNAIKKHATTAATVAVMLLAGCGQVSEDPTGPGNPYNCDEVTCCDCGDGTETPDCCAAPEYGVEPPVCDTVDCSDSNLAPGVAAQCCPQPDYGVEPPTCADISCDDQSLPPDIVQECCPQPEYGVEPPNCAEITCEDPNLPADVYNECCATQPDYGVEPPPCDQVDCADTHLDPELAAQCCPQPEYGVEPPNCDEVDCSDPHTPQEAFDECCGLDYGVEPPDCAQVDCADPNTPPETVDYCCGTTDYGVEPPNCDEVDCADPNTPPEMADYCCPQPEYGVEPPNCAEVNCSDPNTPQEDIDYCCGTTAYGIEPPACDNVDCADPNLPPEVAAQCCAMPEYGVEPPPDCSEVDCSDPNLPPEVEEYCCLAVPEYGIEPPACDNVDCSDPNLPPDIEFYCCSQTDYGIEPPPPTDCNQVDCSDPNLPVEVMEECCAITPDYGIEPEPICEDAPKDVLYQCCDPVDPMVNCEEVCCMCDYGISPPPEAMETCCDPTTGMNKPPIKCEEQDETILKECCEPYIKDKP